MKELNKGFWKAVRRYRSSIALILKMKRDMEKQGRTSKIFLNTEAGSNIKLICHWLDSTLLQKDQIGLEGIY